MTRKLLWHSNSPWSRTGYGAQTRHVAGRLDEHGWDVAVSAFYGLEGGPITLDGHTIYPKLAHPYGNDVLHAHARHHFGGSSRTG